MQLSLAKLIPGVQLWLTLLISVSLLVGCGTLKPIETVTTPVEKTRLDIPPADPLRLSEVRWIVITPENAELVFARLANSGTDQVLIALTDDEYKKLALNIAELRNHIAQQRAIVLGYREYYESKE